VKYAVFFILAWAVGAQPLRVFSEFARIDSSGEIIAPAEPREILSPAIARNAFSSFQVVVQVAKGTHYWLHIGQNPENAVRITLYREAGDRLAPVELSYEGWETQIFWLDVWTDRAAPVRRIKIEPQLFVENDWVVYPMEARVIDTTVPNGPWPEGSIPSIDVMKRFLCENTMPEAAPAKELSASRLQFRNAQQDLALARRVPAQDLRQLLGGCDAPPSDQPEQYLRIRDYLLRMR
jgi:hypothetical protein